MPMDTNGMSRFAYWLRILERPRSEDVYKRQRLLWDEPKIFFLERRYFFSIILLSLIHI